jgi:ADP-heptose:LPS heptosyltransferase
MPRNILVIKLGALGDLFLAMDVFHALKAHHPDDRLSLLTRPAYAALGARMPWFQEVITDTAPKSWQIPTWLALRRRLRAGQFSRVYDLQCNSRTRFYFRLMGPHRPEWAGAAPGCSHPRPDIAWNTQPATEELFQQVAVAGVRESGRADMTWLGGPIASLKIPSRFVMLVPGCSAHRPQKRWPAAHYAALANRLAANGQGVVLVGTAADQDAINAIQQLAPHSINLSGRTDFGQLAALARLTTGVVGNDTGPVHIMATVGAPTLMLMCGESNPVVVLPRGPQVNWLQREPLDDLSVDEVWAAFQKQTAAPAPRRS